MTSVVCLERNNANKADLSIEYATGEDTFEVYVNRIDPASSSECSFPNDESRMSERSYDDMDSLITVKSSDLVIFEMVEKEKWASVFAYVQANPNVASIPILASSKAFTSESQNNLLLHHVCKKGAPIEIVECVLNAHPKAASTRGNRGFLPLHYACAAGAPRQVVEILLDAYASAVMVREEREWRLPLHLAARGGSSFGIEVMTLLLSYYPEGTLIQDRKGNRPIDYAAKHSDTKTRFETVAVLETGYRWIGVAQNVTVRLEEDFAYRRGAIEKDYNKYITSLKEAHDEAIEKIADDLLNVELDREALQEEVKKGKVRLSKLDLELQEKLQRIGDKHDRFLLLQEEDRLERVQMENRHEAELKRLEELLSKHKGSENKLHSELEANSGRVAELEKKLKEQEEQHKRALAAKQAELDKVQAEGQKKEKAFESRIAVLERTHRLKDGVIRRVTAMAKEQEKESNGRISELLVETKEQQTHMNLLLTKLDIFEHQVTLLKDRMKSV